MNSIVAWILSILGIVVVGTIIDLVMPSGRMNKFIKSVFACVTILVIILPLPNLIKNGFKLDGNFIFDLKVELDDDFLNYADRYKFKYMEKGLVEVLSNEGLKGIEAQISGNFENKEIKITKVTINLKNLVIDEDLQHINKYELVYKKVTEYLKVDRGAVIINE